MSDEKKIPRRTLLNRSGSWSKKVFQAASKVIKAAPALITSIIFLFFAFFLVKAVFTKNVAIGSVSVPESLSKRGYTPEVVAERVKGEMGRMAHEAKTSLRLGFLVDRIEQSDIEIPGTSMSFNTLVRFAKEFLGLRDPQINIDVIEFRDNTYLSQSRIFGGEFGDSIPGVTSPASANADTVILNATEAILRITHPAILASYAINSLESRCEGSTCEYGRINALLDTIQSGYVPRSEKADLYMARSYVYLKMERYEETMENCRQVIELVPNAPGAYCNWGFALKNSGNADSAISKYRKAVELDPDYANAFYNWALALEGQNKSDEAIEKYRRTTEISPGYVNAYNNWGVILLNRNSLDSAAILFRRIIELDPKYVNAYNNWGLILAEKGYPDSAIQLYQKAITLDPNFAMAYRNWGFSLEKKNKFREAVEKFKTVLALSPSDSIASHEMQKLGKTVARK